MQLTVASALIQFVNFALLLIAKVSLSDEGFTFLLSQLAISGVIGAVASMRLEVLLFQEHKKIVRASLVVPFAAIVLFCIFSYALSEIAILSGLRLGDLSILAVPMILGLALSEVQSFIFVQIRRLNLLLKVRMIQAALMVGVISVLLSGLWRSTEQGLLFAIGVCYALPALVFHIRFALSIERNDADPPLLYAPAFSVLKKAASLSFSTGLTSVAVNLPVLAATATQSPSFAADFGLIRRAFTAPVTLIAAVFGRLFLADAMRWAISENRSVKDLRRSIIFCMTQSALIYSALALVLSGVLFVFREPLNLTNFHIAMYLFVASLFQSVVNPISRVRTALDDEGIFLAFDIVRLVILCVGLFGLSMLIPFEQAFGFTAVLTYALMIWLVFYRVRRNRSGGASVE